MEITFVNHSSFIIKHKGINLICDPWLEGPAFNHGWSLLSKTKFEYKEFSEITHIWFSHEHPDHFSPPNLLKIPKEFRSQITVLFQETTDKKVIDFCKKIGFKSQVELGQDKYYNLSEDFSVLCNHYTEGDAYALFNVAGKKILNLNDCIVSTEKRAKELANRIGTVDVLFTQFGYAHKVGNIEDLQLRQKSSDEKLVRILHQNKYLKPEIIIPFASFIYFSHVENKYMNNGINKIDKVYSYIEDNLSADCYVMYPGDVWNVNEKWHSAESIKKYLLDYDNIKDVDYLKSDTVSEADLVENARLFINKLKGAYSKKVDFINSLHTSIHVEDLNLSFELSGEKGLFKSKKISLKDCNMSMGSNSLSYCFQELWGGGSLFVNGRYQEFKSQADNDFWKFMAIAVALNREEDFPFLNFIGKVKNKLKTVLKGEV